MARARLVPVLALLAATLSAAPAHPQAALDPASSQGLAETLRMLLDPTLRQGAIAGNPGAAAADAQMRALVGTGPLQHEFYSLAAAIMNDLTRSSGGDATAMLQTLERARMEPAAFAASLSPATQQKLRDFAAKVQQQQQRR